MMTPGHRGDDEGVAPAEVFSYDAADEVAEGRSDEEGYVEDGENAVALVFGIEIGEDRGGKDAEAGFTDAEGGVANQERIVGVDAGGEKVDTRPEESGDDDHGLAWETITEPSSDWRGGHVGDHEPEGEGPDVLVGEVELAFDLFLDAGEDVAVDIVDEVERGEEDEGGGGPCDGGVAAGWFGRGGHLSERIAGEGPGCGPSLELGRCAQINSFRVWSVSGRGHWLCRNYLNMFLLKAPGPIGRDPGHRFGRLAIRTGILRNGTKVTPGTAYA